MMNKNYKPNADIHQDSRAERKTHSAPSYEPQVRTLPTYYHKPLEAGYHEIPIHGAEARVVVNAGPTGHFLTITVTTKSYGR